ncbi:MAG: hypothetical protein U0528_13435 [Anaerolineae bacterium]|nr:hypothetical protein [Anaerolineae bacterium]
MRKMLLSLTLVGAALLLGACNGQLVLERVITTTPDPNQIIITATPQGAASTEAETATVAQASTPTVGEAALVATTPAPVASASNTAEATGSGSGASAIPATVTVGAASTPTLSPFPTETRQEIYIAQMSFEHGYMFWIQARKIVWVLVADSSNPNVGDWYIYNDTFDETVDKDDPSIVAPDGKYVPRRGFGKLWLEVSGLRDALGWGVTPEFGLNTSYRYQPGGYLDSDNKYVQGPGTHFITTLYNEVYALSEPESGGVGRWQRVS